MKRAVILLISLFALSLAGCVCASALVNSAQDAAHFEPETLTGDPALCEGVSVRADTSDVAEFSNRLYFELGFDAASGETDCAFSLNEPIRTGSGYSPSYTDRLEPMIESSLYPKLNTSAADAVLPPHMQYVADKTPAGSEYEETVHLADFYDTWPYYCAATQDYPAERAEEINALLQTTLARPVSEDAVQRVSISKDEDGGLNGFGYNGGQSILELSCECYESFYAFVLRDESSETTEFWLMDLMWSDEDGLYVPDTASLRQLAVRGDGAHMRPAPDGGALLYERGDDAFTLTQVTPEGELGGSFSVATPDGTYYANLWTGGDWALVDTLHAVHAFDYVDGKLSEGPVFELDGTPGYELIDMDLMLNSRDYAYDGERLALLLSFYPLFSDEEVEDYGRWRVQHSEVYLVCADTQGNVCAQSLPNSFMTVPSSTIDYALEMR